MTAAPKKVLTPEEYLAIERQAPYKSEFLNGKMFAMAGASRNHNAIKDNLVMEIGSRLKGGPCRTYSSDMRVKVIDTGLYTYPDITIVCGDAQLEDGQFDTLLNPRVIIEILSDSTESYCRGMKFRHYQRIESLQEYILVSQNEPVIDRFVRQSRWDWLSTTIVDLDKTLELVTVEVKLPLAEIYAGITFPPPPEPQAGSPR